jgi:hypothetical protein
MQASVSAETPSVRCRWTPEELEERARVVAKLWAKLTGRQVAIDHAARIGRLSLPMSQLERVLTKAAHPAIGHAWGPLRAAEAAYLVKEPA